MQLGFLLLHGPQRDACDEHSCALRVQSDGQAYKRGPAHALDDG